MWKDRNLSTKLRLKLRRLLGSLCPLFPLYRVSVGHASLEVSPIKENTRPQFSSACIVFLKHLNSLNSVCWWIKHRLASRNKWRTVLFIITKLNATVSWKLWNSERQEQHRKKAPRLIEQENIQLQPQIKPECKTLNPGAFSQVTRQLLLFTQTDKPLMKLGYGYNFKSSVKSKNSCCLLACRRCSFYCFCWGCLIPLFSGWYQCEDSLLSAHHYYRYQSYFFPENLHKITQRRHKDFRL